jgi:DNA-binding NarL/FixJ family response regulator
MNLSPSEWHILGLLAEGKSNKAIARVRGTAPVTVRDQVESILLKLGVPNRTAAAVMYLKSKI